jgi:hypothetical protein
MICEGVYRRFFPLKGGKGPLDLRLTHQESVAMAQVEPPGLEFSRAGRRFYLSYNGTVPTGIAPVQAFPTSTSQWNIWNPEPVKSYVIRALGVLLFSGTKGLGGELLAALFNGPATATMGTGLAVQNSSFSAISSRAIIRSGTVITQPATPNWFPIAEDPTGVALVGPSNALVNRAIDGQIIVPPLSGLALVYLSPAGTTPLYLPIIEWAEIELDLE